MNCDSASLTKLANRVTRSRMIMEAMGWRFTNIVVKPCHGTLASGNPLSDMQMDGDFTCVCGRRESFRTLLDGYVVSEAAYGSPGAQAALLELLDPAQFLINHGSTSPNHLRADGYTEEQIAEIQDRGLQARAILGERTPMELDKPGFFRRAVVT